MSIKKCKLAQSTRVNSNEIWATCKRSADSISTVGDFAMDTLAWIKDE